MEDIDFNPFNGFEKKFYSIFEQDPKVLQFFREAYFESVPTMTEWDFKDKLYKNLHLYNFDIKDTPKWVIGIQAIQKNEQIQGVACLYVNPMYRRQGYGSKAIDALKFFIRKYKLPLPHLFAIHEEHMTPALEAFYKKNDCKTLSKLEYDKTGIGWYRFFWAPFQYKLIFDEQKQMTVLGVEAEDVQKFLRE